MKTIVGSAEITACIGLVLSGPGAVPISAQTMVGSITGTVRDSSGSSAAVVPNAVVRIANEATGASRQTTTDEHRDYRFDALFIGSYGCGSRCRASKNSRRRGSKSRPHSSNA